MLQVRHVPEDVHRELKARAAREGTSLSDYVLAELVRLASRPTLDELHDRILARDLAFPRGVTVSAGESVARARDEREEHLASTTRRPATPR